MRERWIVINSYSEPHASFVFTFAIRHRRTIRNLKRPYEYPRRTGLETILVERKELNHFLRNAFIYSTFMPLAGRWQLFEPPAGTPMSITPRYNLET